MSILDTIIGKIAPHDCLGCDAEGSLLCAACLDKLTVTKELCYRCQEVSPGGLTCSSCRLASHLRRVQAAALYTGAAKDLVWKLKFAGAQSAAKVMTARMVPLLSAVNEAVIVAVPTATGRVRQRGYDQAGLLARGLAQRARLPCVNYLARTGQAHQVGASREQRLSQLETAFRASRPRAVKGARIILVDDVITTGATLEAAASVLRAAGAARVDAVVFARTPAPQ